MANAHAVHLSRRRARDHKRDAANQERGCGHHVGEQADRQVAGEPAAAGRRGLGACSLTGWRAGEGGGGLLEAVAHLRWHATAYQQGRYLCNALNLGCWRGHARKALDALRTASSPSGTVPYPPATFGPWHRLACVSLSMRAPLNHNLQVPALINISIRVPPLSGGYGPGAGRGQRIGGGAARGTVGGLQAGPGNCKQRFLPALTDATKRGPEVIVFSPAPNSG